MNIHVSIVKAFTKNKDAGNPAGVVLDADSMDDRQMQETARVLGYSESVFIQRSTKADYRLRFFSPLQEVAFCGHNTIAGFHRLLEEGRLGMGNAPSKQLYQETKAGVFSVICHQNGLVEMSQAKPVFGLIEPDIGHVAALLSLTVQDILPHPIQEVSTGVPKLMVPVTSLQKLCAIKPDLEGISDYCRQTGVRGIYPFTSDTFDAASDYHARQFNPLAGINEDPVTGVAAGALSAYLIRHSLCLKNNLVIEQGDVLKMAGRMYVHSQEDGAVIVGGYAVTAGQRVVEV